MKIPTASSLLVTLLHFDICVQTVRTSQSTSESSSDSSDVTNAKLDYVFANAIVTWKREVRTLAETGLVARKEKKLGRLCQGRQRV